MRSLVIHLLLLLFLNVSLSVRSEASSPAIEYSHTLEKEDFLRTFPCPEEKGILFDRLLQPPHPSMTRAALSTGRHAFFQGIYGDFHGMETTEYPPPHNEITSVSRSADNGTDDSGKQSPRLIVGRDFAWLQTEGLAGRRENRPVTPEDLGATFLRLTKNKPIQPLGGRDVSATAHWPILVTHTGEWQPNVVPARMKYRGLTLLCPDGLLENDITWNGQTLDKLAPTDLDRVTPLLNLTSLWWNQVINHLTHPAPVILPANDQTTRLTPNQWQRSCVEPGLPYMPAKGGTWTSQSMDTAIAHLSAPGLGGCWHLYIPREGNYEIVFSLNPPASGESSGRLFKKGESLIRAGNTTARMDIMEGAEEIRIALDLASGKQALEISLTGQGAKDASLSAPYAAIRYKGERVTPTIDFKNRAK